MSTIWIWEGFSARLNLRGSELKSTDETPESLTGFTDWVKVDTLLPADSPRLNGLDEQHVRQLADVYPALPPILVHSGTMRVIDGMHRLAAARRNRLDVVAVRYFTGTEEESFLRSVSANVAHGLPLTPDERKVAARRILEMCPELSDRAVGACTGLSPKTVAAVRPRSTGDSARLNVRMRSNGKAHPLDRTAERLHAAQLMIARPDLPLRAVVRETGLSLGTVHDVRQRLLRGDAPVPAGRRRPPRTEPLGTGVPASRHSCDPKDPLRRVPETPGASAPGRSRTSLEMLRKLASDPSLRHSESGRHFLRWLHDHFVVDDSWRQWMEAVPPHSAATLAELALQCSRTWKRFAEDLASRRLEGVELSEER
ncbi:ParB/RepB/Spo0J family partition protein [Streptomyces sp. NPDC000348]|uniref:ParB/RepB/Spo0J family partition protein n=1 Tax=Streptomyces sp. NPDC000348 TaxID=3364538 RepID=UPI0036995183